jgi:hypothetical protein
MDTPGNRARPRTASVPLVIGLAVLLALALGACGKSPEVGAVEQIDQARNVAAKTEILSIETGIRAYQAMNGTLPAEASQLTLGQLVNPWPKNPWTQAPMQPGTGKGDYTYAQTNDGFILTVHLDGSDYSRP